MNDAHDDAKNQTSHWKGREWLTQRYFIFLGARGRRFGAINIARLKARKSFSVSLAYALALEHSIRVFAQLSILRSGSIEGVSLTILSR